MIIGITSMSRLRNVTSAKVERFVHSIILPLKVVVEVPEGEAQETRLHKK